MAEVTACPNGLFGYKLRVPTTAADSEQAAMHYSFTWPVGVKTLFKGQLQSYAQL